jgi:hypothetical protein
MQADDFSTSDSKLAVDTKRVDPKSRLGLAAIVSAAGAGVLVGALGFCLGLGNLRGMGLVALLLGGVALAVVVYLFERGVRRRARMEAIAELLPRFREHQMEDEFLFEEPDLGGDDRSAPPLAARTEIRAATRALLVSLEEEMRREKGQARRSARPGCRRARLRAVGRSEPRRRRVSLRAATLPS